MEGELRNYKISPMIFLPLLENAVKYSAEIPSPRVSVVWVFNEDKLEVSITNSCNPNSPSVKSTKVGVENLQRRLELYHPHHKLTLLKKENEFTANLILWNLSYAA